MAQLTAEDRCLIRCLRVEKGWNAIQMMRKFPSRKWKKSTLNDLIRKIAITRTADRAQGNHFIFQPDGTQVHRSRQTISFLNIKVPEFIKPKNWPPNSPDLNPVDYSIWGALQHVSYRQKI